MLVLRELAKGSKPLRARRWPGRLRGFSRVRETVLSGWREGPESHLRRNRLLGTAVQGGAAHIWRVPKTISVPFQQVGT